MASQFRWTSKSVDLLSSSGKLHRRKMLDQLAGILGRKEKNSQGRYSDSALGDGGVKAGHEEKGIGMVDKTKTKEERNEKSFEVHERARNNLN